MFKAERERGRSRRVLGCNRAVSNLHALLAVGVTWSQYGDAIAVSLEASQDVHKVGKCAEGQYKLHIMFWSTMVFTTFI